MPPLSKTIVRGAGIFLAVVLVAGACGVRLPPFPGVSLVPAVAPSDPRPALPPVTGAGAGSAGYDWDRIIGDAHALLAERQREDFGTAVEYRRASEKMSAMAAKKK